MRLDVTFRVKTVLVCGVLTSAAGFRVAWGQTSSSGPADEVPGVRSEERTIGGDPQQRYVLIQTDPPVQPPAEGYGLVLVIPGGDGSTSSLGFAKRVFKASLSDRYVVAYLVAPRWSPDQKLVWPTEQLTTPGQRFSTEAFATAVVRDVSGMVRVDRGRVLTFAWSTGGPAAYALSVARDTPVRGSLIAMSVFTPSLLPSLERARGQAYYLYHSPDDKVSRFEFATTARELLSNQGAAVELATYDGGHGWQGPHFVRLSAGFRWLEDRTRGVAGATSRPTDERGADSVEGREAAAGAGGGNPTGSQPPMDRPASGGRGDLHAGPVVAPGAATQPAGEVNVVPNGGFENGTAGWLVMNNSGKSSFQIDRQTVHEGAAALRITRAGGGPTDAIRRSLEIPGAGRYVVSAFVRCKDAGGAVLKFFAYDEAGNPLVFDVDVAALPAAPEWTRVSKTYSLTAAVRTASVMLVVPADGTIWLDDVRVSPDNSRP